LPLALDVVDQQGEDDDDDKSESNNAIDIHPPSLPPPPVRPVDKVPWIHDDHDEETNEILLTDLNANPLPAEETNEILLIPPVEEPSSGGSSSVGHGDDEEEEEEEEEEEKDSASKTAKQLRLLHGQIDLDPLLLDDSCDASTTTALPHISYTIVAKYGR
jgi:hypothetical protein